jgi:predicted metal-dependent hydrolase
MTLATAHGVELFNRGVFFECHEVWEAEWTPDFSHRRWFLQSLIHLAVGFYHHEQENPDGRDRQLAKGLKKLAGYLPEYEGIDTWNLYETAERWRRGELTEYPRIRRAAPADPGL